MFLNHKCWFVHIYIHTQVRKHGSCANFHVRWCMEGLVCAIIPGGKWAARMVICGFRSRRPGWDGLLGSWALSPCPAWCQCATRVAELHPVLKLNFSFPWLHSGSTKPLPHFSIILGEGFMINLLQNKGSFASIEFVTQQIWMGFLALSEWWLVPWICHFES